MAGLAELLHGCIDTSSREVQQTPDEDIRYNRSLSDRLTTDSMIRKTHQKRCPWERYKAETVAKKEEHEGSSIFTKNTLITPNAFGRMFYCLLPDESKVELFGRHGSSYIWCKANIASIQRTSWPQSDMVEAM